MSKPRPFWPRHARARAGAVFRLTPLLRDKSVAVAAAAVAALVRVVARRCFRSCSGLQREGSRRVHHACARAGLAFRGASAEMLDGSCARTLRAFASRPPAPSATRHDEAAAKVQSHLVGAATPELRLLAGPALDRTSEPRRRGSDERGFRRLISRRLSAAQGEWSPQIGLLANSTSSNRERASLRWASGWATRPSRHSEVNSRTSPQQRKRSASFRPVRKPDAIAFGVAHVDRVVGLLVDGMAGLGELGDPCFAFACARCAGPPVNARGVVGLLGLVPFRARPGPRTRPRLDRATAIVRHRRRAWPRRSTGRPSTGA